MFLQLFIWIINCSYHIYKSLGTIFTQFIYVHTTCYVSYRFKGHFNSLTPNGHYSGRTAPLTSKRCILYIYSTNIGTEYFKHGIHSPFIFLFKMQFVS